MTETFDPLALPSDAIEPELMPPPGSRVLARGKWSADLARRVLEIVAECGSPGLAAKRLGIAVGTIMYHKGRDAEFRARYDEAMRHAVELVVTDSIARARDIADPSNEAFTLAWLRLRGDRINGYLDGQSEPEPQAGGLDPQIVCLMEPADRRLLLTLLTKYMNLQNGAPNAKAIANF